MKRLFQDESGEFSFSLKSTYKHGLITIISVSSSEVNKLKTALKRKFSKFIRNGWHKDREFKAADVHRDIRFGKPAINDIIKGLVKIPSLEINYIVVNKEQITTQSFRQAPYGTAYNYFTGVLLSEMIFEDGLDNTYLIYDKRNKETHNNKHFEEYISTRIFGKSLEDNTEVSLKMEGLESNNCYGLLAVDYFSWAIFRKFELDDDSFFRLFEYKLRRRRQWYIKK